MCAFMHNQYACMNFRKCKKPWMMHGLSSVYACMHTNSCMHISFCMHEAQFMQDKPSFCTCINFWKDMHKPSLLHAFKSNYACMNLNQCNLGWCMHQLSLMHPETAVDAFINRSRCIIESVNAYMHACTHAKINYFSLKI